MGKNYRKIASGGHVKAKRITACEICNFMELYNSKGKLRTGSYCPRCNSPTVRVYDSKAEFTRAQELKLMQERGEIQDLEFQPRFPLHAHSSKELNPDNTPANREAVHLYDYVADFAYNKFDEETNSEIYVVEDVKGSSRGKPIITDVAEMKIKHFEAEYGIPVHIVMR